MVSIVSTSNMLTPFIRCHYMPNLNIDLVRYSEAIIGRNGMDKMDGSYSVEAVCYTYNNGNIRLVTPASFSNLNVYA